MDYGKCFLPGGYFDETGQLHKEVELAALSGREEELLLSTAGRGGAVQVTAVLSRCIKRLGTFTSIDDELTRRLLVGDRRYLMLKLRELTFGGRVQATVTCPWPDCGGGVDVSFNIPDIPIKDAQLIAPVHELALAAGTQESPVKILFRLPAGADQEAMSDREEDNEAMLLSRLLWRCIERIDDNPAPTLEQVHALPSQTRRQIEQRMQALAPDVELTMEAECPECQRDFTVPFDIQEFFFGELKTSRELLRREIHYLAYHYHWSEREIMEMPQPKRRKYIEVLAEEIERLNDAVR